MASGFDPLHIQNLELRVCTLLAACEGDVSMPVQCTGRQCIPLAEYVRQLQEVDAMLTSSLQYGQQQGGYPQQQNGYPQQQGGYAQQQGGYY